MSNTTAELRAEGGVDEGTGDQMSPRLRLVYFVHDLGDPAVSRRLLMLRPFLVSAVVIGFHRAAMAPAEVAGWPAVALGRTKDGRLGLRMLSVLRIHAMISRFQTYLRGATVIMARQLEMLMLAAAGRRRYAETSTLIYECLDIHRLMVAPSLIGTALRRLESRLLLETDGLVVSSPAFSREHLRPIHGESLPPVCLIENKVLQAELACPSAVKPRPTGPPWHIGWYGVLRCRRSLEILADLTRKLPGQIIVELRGRPAISAIPDFDALVAAAPDIRFLGRYDRRHDLGEIYQSVHFSWAVDFFEAGMNSRWLLPNRLYEGGLHGAVPIALSSVETGHWLAEHGAGVLLDEPVPRDLYRYFSALSPSTYAKLAAALAALPRDAWVDQGADGTRLATALHRRRKPPAAVRLLDDRAPALRQ